MANNYAGGVGGTFREGKEGEEESRHTGEVRRRGEETRGSGWKSGDTT